jgi:hypothetical protein
MATKANPCFFGLSTDGPSLGRQRAVQPVVGIRAMIVGKGSYLIFRAADRIIDVAQ